MKKVKVVEGKTYYLAIEGEFSRAEDPPGHQTFTFPEKMLGVGDILTVNTGGRFEVWKTVV